MLNANLLNHLEYLTTQINVLTKKARLLFINLTQIGKLKTNIVTSFTSDPALFRVTTTLEDLCKIAYFLATYQLANDLD